MLDPAVKLGAFDAARRSVGDYARELFAKADKLRPGAGAALNAALANVAVPAELEVGASYGITIMNGASPDAARFVQFALAADGQRILARHGFGAP